MIVATAGHVDHGKTSLVKQLTGVDTDRLEEEKRRGLSINLGFAYRSVGEHATLGLVDVPGHTRFINTMIAGVGGIDLGMLVVAADDGVMPQTREHLDVLRLLGIDEFIAVISKIDRVEVARADNVSGQVRTLLGEASCSAVFTLSNTSGDGVQALRDYLDARALAQQQRSSAGNFRLWVDRAFLLRGTGLVLTGTALAGTVALGDVLQLLPAGLAVRVRSLHVDDRAVERGHAGQRCALNVSGPIARDQVSRGDVLVADPGAPLSERLDVEVSLLPNAPFAIKHLSPVTLHIGAARTSARLYLLNRGDNKSLVPGAQSLAQLILQRPLACCRGDRFLIRDDSESVTLGGGMVLDPLAPRSGKSHGYRLHYLGAMAMDSPLLALQSLLQDANTPINLTNFCAAWNLRTEERTALLQATAVRCFSIDKLEYALSSAGWQHVRKTLLTSVQHWHQDNPGQQGVSVTALQRQLTSIASGSLFRSALSELLHEDRLDLVHGLVKIPGYQACGSDEEQARWCKLALHLESRALHLPLVSELVDSTGLDTKQVLTDLNLAVHQGKAVKLNANRYALPQHLAEHAAIIAELDRSGAGISIVTFKERIACGRRLAIEILEYFDDIRFTQRRGEQRVVLDSDLPASLFSK